MNQVFPLSLIPDVFPFLDSPLLTRHVLGVFVHALELLGFVWRLLWDLATHLRLGALISLVQGMVKTRATRYLMQYTYGHWNALENDSDNDKESKCVQLLEENILLRIYSLLSQAQLKTNQHELTWGHIAYSSGMFLLVLFYEGKRDYQSSFSPFGHLKWPWTWLMPSLKIFTGATLEGYKYSSFPGMRRGLMGNRIQQSCRILLQQIFFLNDVFFISCLDSKLFLASTQPWHIQLQCAKNKTHSLSNMLFPTWTESKPILKLNAASRLMVITASITLRVTVKKDQRDKR